MKKIFLILLCILCFYPNKVRDRLFVDATSFFETKYLFPYPFENKNDPLTKPFLVDKQKKASDFLSIFFKDKKAVSSQSLCLLKKQALQEQIYPASVISQVYHNTCTFQNPDAYLLNMEGNNLIVFKQENQFCTINHYCLTLLYHYRNFYLLEEKKRFKKNILPFFETKPHHLNHYNMCPDPQQVLSPQITNAYQKEVRQGSPRGRLGNQLFEYWSGAVYALKHKKNFFLEHPNEHLLDLFDLKEHEQACHLLTAERTAEQQKIEKFLFQGFPKNGGSGNQLQDRADYIRIDGYLQAYHNLKGYESYIRQKMILKKELSDKHKELIKTMQQENSVAIHVRRGDYVRLSTFYHQLTPQYYKRAIDYIKERVPNPHFYIFSNDINWAKQNLAFDENITFVDWTKHDWEDLTLMRSCKHFIIANSTFSWWGAFLSDNPDKIVIIPQNWIFRSAWGTFMPADNWVVFENE